MSQVDLKHGPDVLHAADEYVKEHPTDVLLVVYDDKGVSCLITKDVFPDLAEDLDRLRAKFLTWREEQFKKE
jgi:hypothetical protein